MTVRGCMPRNGIKILVFFASRLYAHRFLQRARPPIGGPADSLSCTGCRRSFFMVSLSALATRRWECAQNLVSRAMFWA